MLLRSALAVLLISGCATPRGAAPVEPEPAAATETAPAAAPARTLFERLGGLSAIELVVDGLLQRAFADESINYTWAGSALPRVRKNLIDLVCAGTGGGCVYAGRSMVDVHKHMRITGAQFDTLVGHLIATLDEAGVPEQEKNELLGILGPMRGDIVTETP